MGHTGLINTFEDAKEFAKHPVKPFDPFYTRDFDTWSAYFDDFKRFIIGELHTIIENLESRAEVDDDLHFGNLQDRKYISELYVLWYGTLKKLKAYDSASGHSLLVGKINSYRLDPFTRF